MKIVNVYSDVESGGYTFEYTGRFYPFLDDVEEELQEVARKLTEGFPYIPLATYIASSLELDLITTYEFEEE